MKNEFFFASSKLGFILDDSLSFHNEGWRTFAASKSAKSFKVFATFRIAGNSAAFVWCACENLFYFQIVFKAVVKWLKNSFHAHLYFKQNDAAIATSILDQLLAAFLVPVSPSAPSAYKILQ